MIWREPTMAPPTVRGNKDRFTAGLDFQDGGALVGF